jgi:hypothetical protein
MNKIYEVVYPGYCDMTGHNDQDDRIIARYSNKKEAERHCNSLNEHSNQYIVREIEILDKYTPKRKTIRIK